MLNQQGVQKQVHLTTIQYNNIKIHLQKTASFKSHQSRIKKHGSPTQDYVRDETQENEMTLKIPSQIDRFSLLSSLYRSLSSIM